MSGRERERAWRGKERREDPQGAETPPRGVGGTLALLPISVSPSWRPNELATYVNLDTLAT